MISVFVMFAEIIFLLSALLSNPGWSLVDSGVSDSIRGISAVDAQVCWIGTKAGVARTIDGGKTWRFTKIGDEILDFRDLHAFDAQCCVAMSAGQADASRIYRTTDGGESWQLAYQNTEPLGFFNGIAFGDARRGILAGDPVGSRLFLLASTDGGISWRRIAAASAPEMGDGEHAFAASGTHLCVGRDGKVWVTSGGVRARVFRSDDWGETWTSHATPMIAGGASTGIFSITFRGAEDEVGLAVGGDYQKETEGQDNAMRSSDGGRTWQLIQGGDGAAPFPFRSCLGFVGGGNVVVAVGPSGSDISRDGGVTWNPLAGAVGFHTLSVAGDTVWAAGAGGRVGILTVRSGE